MTFSHLSFMCVLIVDTTLGLHTSSHQDKNLELVHVNVLFRHGARSPVFDFPSNPNADYQWNQNGGGQLTTLGMRQTYNLGRYFRERYNGFLSSAYDREEIYIRSTDRDRTIMSAQCALAGLYQPEGNQVWIKYPPIMWQPIPVHTVPIKEDTLLYFPKLHGPRHEMLLKHTLSGNRHVRISKLYKGFLQKLQELAEIKGNFSAFDIYNVYDPLTAANGPKPLNLSRNASGFGLEYLEFDLLENKLEYQLCYLDKRAEGLPSPPWYNKKRRQRVTALTTYFLGAMFGYQMPLQNNFTRLFAGRLIGQLLENFEGFIDGNNTYKAIAYSAHDLTIVELLIAFDNYHNHPSYASALMFELYKDTSSIADQQYVLKTFYRTSSNREPLQLDLLGCGLNCSLNELRRRVTDLLPSDGN